MEYTYTTLNALPEVTDDFVQRYNVLMAQLRSTPCNVTTDDLEEVKKRSDSELLMCVFSEDELMGFAQGTYVCTPPSHGLYINTVVVDTSTRGQGIGTILMNELEAVAMKRWPRIETASLTSRPNRGARTFYERLSYIPRVPENDNETTVFIKKLT